MCEEPKRTPKRQSDLKKGEHSWSQPADFKLNYETTGIRKVWIWHKNRHTHQSNKTENTEINMCM